MFFIPLRMQFSYSALLWHKWKLLIHSNSAVSWAWSAISVPSHICRAISEEIVPEYFAVWTSAHLSHSLRASMVFSAMLRRTEETGEWMARGTSLGPLLTEVFHIVDDDSLFLTLSELFGVCWWTSAIVMIPLRSPT